MTTDEAEGPAARAETRLGQEPAVRRRWAVRNETPRRLVVEGADGAELVLAPLEERLLDADPTERFDLRLLQDRRQLTIEKREEFAESYSITVGIGFWALVAYLAVGAALGRSGWLWGGLILLAGIPSLYVLSTGKRAAFAQWLRKIRPYGTQLVTLVLALLIGVGIPGGVIYAGTDLQEAIDRAIAAGTVDETTRLALVGRGLQVVFVAAFALVPALLYFLSDREQLRTQRERFTREVFRLDPSVSTVSDVNAKYGGLMEEVYGAPARLRARLVRGRRSPILVATLVISLGWVLTLLNSEVVGRTDASAGVIGQILRPVDSVVAFGFLGAYFFALYAVLRGYVRGDLRPKTYSTITVRIMVVTILAWVIERVFPDGAYLYALAFVTGVVPETALLRIQELVRGKTREWKRIPSLTERHPLTSLQGIDLYDRARLADEGITNVEGLAHADLVELMLKTRVPAASLVDWTDQAILYLHAGDDSEDETDRGAVLARLQQHGVRTATDLLGGHAAAVERDGDGDAFLAELDANGGRRMKSVLDAIGDEEWIAALRSWHSAAHQRERVLRVKARVPAAGRRAEGPPAGSRARAGRPLALRA